MQRQEGDSLEAHHDYLQHTEVNRAEYIIHQIVATPKLDQNACFIL